MLVESTADLQVIRLVRWSANRVGDGVKVGVDVGDGRCGSVVVGVGWRSIFRSRVGRCECAMAIGAGRDHRVQNLALRRSPLGIADGMPHRAAMGVPVLKTTASERRSF